MINEKMQDDVWRSLPKDFKDEIKRAYNSPYLSITSLTMCSTLEWLFGVGNLTEDETKEEEKKEREILKKLKRKYEK